MQAINVDGSDERLAIAALCLDVEVLKAVAPDATDNMFGSKWANLITKWAVDYYNSYKEAPGPAGLTALYTEWANTTGDKDTVNTVGRWLSSLESGLTMSSQYAVDLIHRLASKSAATRHAAMLQAALDNGKVDKAIELAESFKRPTISKSNDFIEPFTDPELIERAYQQSAFESLIKFPAGSAICEFFGPTLARDSLVGFTGIDKSGKSTHLAQLCIRALTQNLRVAFFNLGDLSESQVIRRWSTAFVGRPPMPMNFNIPKSLAYEDKEPIVEFDVRAEMDGYTVDDAKQAWLKYARYGDSGRLRLVNKRANEISIYQLVNIVRKWADKGWVPDIIAIDYADLLAPPPGFEQSHQAIDDTWKEMRAMTTEFRCLGMTATQSKADGYSSWLLGRESFSGSKAKNAHVNAMVGINITEVERANQVCRFNWIVLREAEYMLQYPKKILAVAGTPAIGRYHKLSCWV